MSLVRTIKVLVHLFVIVNGIKKAFHSKQQQELLHKAEKIVREKLDKLSVQEEKQSLSNAEFVNHCSNNEVMSMHADVRSQMKRDIEEHGKADRIIEPVEEIDMGVEVGCAEALQQLCQTQAKITTLPIVCTVSR